MNELVDVAILGAGPYGMSLAAHLRQLGVSHRIFGSPMQAWLSQMPRGMMLKSDGLASSLFDRDSSFTLRHYCNERGIPYADHWKLVPLDVFAEYGLEFQRRFVPGLDPRLVNRVNSRVHSRDTGFEIQLEDGERFVARNVVVATGIGRFVWLPPELRGLPRERVTHSSEHSDLGIFKGREVIVVGAGASAIDTAALLHEAGTSVQLTARSAAIDFPGPFPKRIPRPFWQELRHPTTAFGIGWRMLFFERCPQGFRRLPVGLRRRILRRFLGPAPGPFMEEGVAGKVQMHLGLRLLHAEVCGDRVKLRLAARDGSERTLSADHVIAATGYRVDLERLDFLAPELRSRILLEENFPALSPNFESSARGLYFTGLTAALSFGPMFRFVIGARYAAMRLSRRLASSPARISESRISES